MLLQLFLLKDYHPFIANLKLKSLEWRNVYSMVEYYRYLFQISWPAGSLLVILYVFVLYRLFQKIKHVRKYEWDGWGIFVLCHKIIFWIFILMTYLLMFFRIYPDWLAQPAVYKGEVQDIDYDVAQGRYYMHLLPEAESGSVKLWVDERTFYEVELGSQVVVKSLYFRQEVYSCEVLPDAEDVQVENTQISE